MNTTVDDFQTFWTKYQTNAPGTYHARVNRFLAWARAEGKEISVLSLRLWLDHLSKNGASASYRSGYFYAIKCALLAWNEEENQDRPRTEAEISGWALSKELSKIKLPKIVQGKRATMVKELKPEELDRVIRSATPRVSAVIEFLADTGLRVSEMTTLRLKNARRFNDDFAFVTVIGKGDKERTVWLQCNLLDRVRTVFQGQVYLFETRTGRPLDPDNVYKQVRSTFKRVAGVALTPHNMRHYCAMRLLHKGASPASVARFLGHSTPTTTAQFYDSSDVPLDALRTKHHGERGRNKKQEAKV